MVRDLARREGLTVFDYEAEEITAADKRAHRRMIAAAKRELEEEEREGARQEFQRLVARAGDGDVAAQFAVGQMRSFGEGVEQDAAAAWCARAAAAGNVDAMVNLAALYRSGRGVPRDLANAAAWLERALPHDGLIAAFELGQMCATGEGVPKDARWTAGRRSRLYSVVLPSKCSSEASASAFVTCTVRSTCSGGP